jgi:DNA polymerase III subunit epsilon
MMGRTAAIAATPLRDVTFCVLDVETTGSSPATDALTELGAVLVRGGECLGTFQSLIHPGRAIPPRIIGLTGITDGMVTNAPRPEGVLASFTEFRRDAVIVGHNVRFDLGFLGAALDAVGLPALPGPAIDTCVLARRLVGADVPDCRLGTLAAHLRLDHRPNHRALDDALATVDLLHALLERATAYGVHGLDDLVELHRITGHRYSAKLRLTEDLPRSPGVYEFRDRSGRPLYVGMATNLRQRVRSYFGRDERRHVHGLLRDAHHIHHTEFDHPLIAAVAEHRLIRAFEPPYNKIGKRPAASRFVQLTSDAFPRLTVSARRTSQPFSLGPVPPATAARMVEAIEAALPVRRCRERLSLRGSPVLDRAPCPPAVLGVATCPCSGAVTLADYTEIVRSVERLLERPHLVVVPLVERMHRLARDRRFEEAALTRDRLRAFAGAVHGQRLVAALVEAGHADIELDRRVLIEVDHGRVSNAGTTPGISKLAASGTDDDPGEPLLIARWLLRHPQRWRLVHSTGSWTLEQTDAQLASITAPSWSMRNTFEVPSAGNAATTLSTRSDGQNAAIVGPEPDNHPHHAPAPSASSIAACDGRAA